jgi:hypothetical protein
MLVNMGFSRDLCVLGLKNAFGVCDAVAGICGRTANSWKLCCAVPCPLAPCRAVRCCPAARRLMVRAAPAAPLLSCGMCAGECSCWCIMHPEFLLALYVTCCMLHTVAAFCNHKLSESRGFAADLTRT